jgi:4-amino-4-deoxy-L-arabinose transferase-like glycosyltransferase
VSRPLFLCLALAAILRLVALGAAPPGLHVDAAANAWTAKCLLEHGTDWHGVAWPVFYSRGFGENQTTLYYYLLLPFQALLGMSPRTTALPSCLAGIALIALVYLVVRRLFDETTALVAAALVAVAPPFLLLSRWGHESGVAPFLSLLPPSLLLFRRPARTVDALLAGIAAGIACYGYYALRIFLPLLALALLLVSLPAAHEVLRLRQGRRAVVAFLLGFLPLFLPLAWEHWTDPEIFKRGAVMALWQPGETWATILGRLASRYVGQFSPEFLFLRGDTFPLHTLPGSGPLRWVWLPFLVIGIVAVLRSARRSLAARAVVAWALVMPFGDLLTRHPSAHLLRVAPGFVVWIVLTAIGVVLVARRAASITRRAGLAWVLLGALFVVDAGVALRGYFSGFARRADLYRLFNADVLEAATWLKPRLTQYDLVLFSARDSAALSQPFVLLLVAWDYDPAAWFAEPREVETRSDTDRIHRFGKTIILFDDADLARLQAYQRDSVAQRVAIVARPGEWTHGTPAFVARAPDGSPSLVVHEVLF